MLISIVVPICNEESVLPQFYGRLSAVLQKCAPTYEILFINDGSRDRTLEILLEFKKQNPNVKILDFSRNFGHQTAITAGLDHAKGDAAIIMDGDLQHPPEIIPELLRLWEQGFLIVTPVKRHRTGEGLFKQLTARGFYAVIRLISNVDIVTDASDFRLLDRRVVEMFKNLREQHRFLRGLSSWLGYKQTTLPYDQDERYSGETKFSLWQMVDLALDGITSFSQLPLQLASCMGFIFAGFGGVYGLYAVWKRLFTHETVPGWTSLMIVVSFLGGIQLLTLGIFGTYLGRVYDEVKRRPLYILNGFYD